MSGILHQVLFYKWVLLHHPQKRPGVALIHLSKLWATVKHDCFPYQDKHAGMPQGLTCKRGLYFSVFYKRVCIGLQRLSSKPCRTWGGLLLACLGKQAEAIIISPDAFLPGLRDVAWAGGSSRVLCKLSIAHIILKVKNTACTVRGYEKMFTENGKIQMPYDIFQEF